MGPVGPVGEDGAGELLVLLHPSHIRMAMTLRNNPVFFILEFVRAN